ncbi:hypothetical protein ABZN20_02205 [Methylococcus sp. ANG]|uniref:hypothetical protein n=1 Tax=Methylococcus sp. ANG TaxID=3231903 RepID=UPI0034582CD6
MATYYLIATDNTIVNTVLADSAELALVNSDPGVTAVTQLLAKHKWPQTTPAVPQTVSRFKAIQALEDAGVLSQVESVINDPASPSIYRNAFNNAMEFERQSPTIAAVAQILGWTDAQLDELFIAASQIPDP